MQLGTLGGRTKTFRRFSAQYPKQMAEVMELFNMLGIGGKEGLSRANIQAINGFPILKRKRELERMRLEKLAAIKAAESREFASYVVKALYPKPITPAVAKASSSLTDPETPIPIGVRPDPKKNAPMALALVGGSLLFSMMG